MSVQILVGTRKGLFFLTSDDARRDWQVDGPELTGWEIMHAVRDPRDGALYACSSNFVYSATVQQLVSRFGQSGLAVGGATICGVAYLLLAGGLAWWIAPIAVGFYGFGFYALHNTLQTCGTQMTPQARATAFALFSSAIYVAQTVGVGASALVFDRFGAVPLFVAAGLVLPAMALWFARELKRRG